MPNSLWPTAIKAPSSLTNRRLHSSRSGKATAMRRMLSAITFASNVCFQVRCRDGTNGAVQARSGNLGYSQKYPQRGRVEQRFTSSRRKPTLIFQWVSSPMSINVVATRSGNHPVISIIYIGWWRRRDSYKAAKLLYFSTLILTELRKTPKRPRERRDVHGLRRTVSGRTHTQILW